MNFKTNESKRSKKTKLSLSFKIKPFFKSLPLKIKYCLAFMLVYLFIGSTIVLNGGPYPYQKLKEQARAQAQAREGFILNKRVSELYFQSQVLYASNNTPFVGVPVLGSLAKRLYVFFKPYTSKLHHQEVYNFLRVTEGILGHIQDLDFGISPAFTYDGNFFYDYLNLDGMGRPRVLSLLKIK